MVRAIPSQLSSAALLDAVITTAARYSYLHRAYHVTGPIDNRISVRRKKSVVRKEIKMENIDYLQTSYVVRM